MIRPFLHDTTKNIRFDGEYYRKAFDTRMKITHGKKILASVLSILAVIIVLPLLAGLVQSIIASARLNRVMSELAKDEIPATWDELRERVPQCDPERKGQTALFAALDQLKEIPHATKEDQDLMPFEGFADLPQPNEKVPSEMLLALERRLKQVGTTLTVLQDAINQRPSLFLKPSLDAHPLFEYLGSLRQVVRLCAMEAVMYCGRDDPDAAMDSVVRGIELAHLFETDPTIIGGLVRIACDGIALCALEFTLAHTDPSPTQMQKMARLLEQEAQMDLITGAMGEIAYTRVMYQLLCSNPEALMNSLKYQKASVWQHALGKGPGPIGSGWLRMNEAMKLEFLHRMVESWHLPWHEFKKAHTRAVNQVPRFYILGAMANDIFDGIRLQNLRMQGQLKSALIALAIERYQQEKGVFPDRLALLVSEYLEQIPTDPFMGKPLKYEVQGDIGRIYFEDPESESLPEYPGRKYELEFRVYLKSAENKKGQQR